MPVYLYKLIPPRPTFPAGMTEAEGAAMQQHFGYWQEQMRSRRALVVGPVADPKGTYGVAIVQAPKDEDAKRICAGDPVLKTNLGFAFELHAMPDAMTAEG